MSKRQKIGTLTELKLDGLELAPSQCWKSIRVVPLLRSRPLTGLRLSAEINPNATVSVTTDKPGEVVRLIPQGMSIASETGGEVRAAFGTRLVEHMFTERAPKRHGAWVQIDRVETHTRGQVGFLPLFLAMEGFMGWLYDVPDIAFEVYSRMVLRRRLSPRWETLVPGRALHDLDDALNIFEICEGQCGVLLFIGDALASAFVLPHPEDYRLLHRSLLSDFYGAMLWQYGRVRSALPQMSVRLDDSKVEALADLRAALSGARSDWAAFDRDLARSMIARPLLSQEVQKVRGLSLQRFTTALRKHEPNHVGEAVVTDSGALAYLKTFRLSRAQLQRARWLRDLSRERFNLELIANARGLTREVLISRLDDLGLSYLVSEDVLKVARAKRR